MANTEFSITEETINVLKNLKEANENNDCTDHLIETTLLLSNNYKEVLSDDLLNTFYHFH